mgnify:CR=1 FL=1
MDNRTLRFLIYFFLGLLGLFMVLMAVNYAGSLLGRQAAVTEEKKGPLTPTEMAAQTIADARNRGGLPPPRTNFSSAPFSSGGVMVVKNKDFNGVAARPKTMMELLSELGGGDRSKPAPIKITDTDMDKKIAIGGEVKPPKVAAASMPEIGREAGQEGATLLSVPVDYKLFKSAETWAAFAAARKQKAVAHDFSKSDLLILVSLSDFPNGIFSVAGVEPDKKETVVKYRVNPMAMTPETPAAQRDAYAAAPVPKGVPVRLVQVP